jgi:hypothetical protein
LIVEILVVSSVLLAFAKVRRRDRNTDRYALDPVAMALELRRSHGQALSVYEKALYRMGDRVSVDLMKILGGVDPIDSGTGRSVLSMLRVAFGTPELIQTEGDRCPTATMSLLEQLERRVIDDEVRKESRALAESLKAKFVKPNPQRSSGRRRSRISGSAS